jgi:zinc protease
MLTPELLSEIDLDRALDIWRERFADASDFWFFLVGSFDLETVRPLVERWVGSLPASHRGETWRDVGLDPPGGVVRFEVRRGIEPKASVRLVFTGDATWNRIERYAMASMTRALSIRLREVLREDLGGVYGVGVSGSISRWPKERYATYLSFGCDPGRVDELIAAARAEIDAFRADGPAPDLLDKVRESQIRERETSLEQNGWWTGALQSQFINGLDPLDILRFDELLGRLTPQLLRDAAVKYFDPERMIQGVLAPETEETPR